MKLTNKQKELYDRTNKVMGDLNLKDKSDYYIFSREIILFETNESTLCCYIQFRKENESNIIKSLKGLGWVNHMIYLSLDGDPSYVPSDIDNSDEEGGNFEVVRMKCDM